MGMKRRLSNGFIQAVLAILAIGWIMPLVWVVLMAFKDPNNPNSVTSLFGGLMPSLQNFVDAWQSAQFGMYYVNTIELVAGIVIIQLITTTLAGYAFARIHMPGRNIIFIMFLLQLMVPVSALIIPNYMTMQNLHLVNTKWAIMLPYFASAMGTFLMRQTFRQLPREIEEAATMDGAKWWQILWHVLLPGMRPALVAFTLVSVSFHWNDFLWPLIVTSTPQTQPLTIGLQLLTQMGETGAQWQMICAGTLIVVAPLLILFIIFQRKFVNSFMQTGMK
ncbi:carbohydrate ABC transporter permease [Alicyclobacillus dauci]|uniref:Carbohydrate ABC transporter permease n=1 Tax=Alicyclobacillus dauci TaxID=1475485 RepID=A0ABY6Z416_9BACL|nr:carbohydrate ABC transporter permease [Alicyclobacillus dauci]WAH37591.1 carbohydrate ABC transporter permease [Alicyclobacillus dauci]